ncbi:glycosyltransferase WbuB [Limnohabitans curvus]|uniref:Glycosyltransferase WbuB n=1 Tax=Limnohabitans curvus TaxID=323423 RepID=A0A315EUB8_9BURK|nr:glycosyltransferase WbuB [Limnohabitans curvus]
MRLLVVTQYFWPENFRINDLVGELVQRGYQVTVITGVPNYPDGQVFPAFLSDSRHFDHYEGAKVYRVPMLPRGKGGLRLLLNYISFALSASTVGIWKLRGQQYDAIFAYEPSPITVGLPAVATRFVKSAPLLFWVQDLWPETLKAVGVVKSPMLLSAVGKLVAFIYKRCDVILAQSKSFIPQILKYAPTNKRVLYFPNWSDKVLTSDELIPAPEVPSDPSCFSVMFAGNIGDAQDFPAILAAAETLKGHAVRWLIVGDGRMASWVAEEIKKRGLQDQVLMLGRFPSERMSSFFKHADALLVSLKDEPIFAMTIPSKLQTYFSAGIPVLAMLNGEGAHVVRESGSGITCRAGDHEGLAKAVLQLSQTTPQERQEMGRKGRELSEREFARDTLISCLEGLIGGLCNGAAKSTDQRSKS